MRLNVFWRKKDYCDIETEISLMHELYSDHSPTYQPNLTLQLGSCGYCSCSAVLNLERWNDTMSKNAQYKTKALLLLSHVAHIL